MNYRMILSLLGDVLLVIGAFLLLPCIVAVIYGEPELWVLLASAAGSGLLGGLFILLRPKRRRELHARDGFVMVALSWILISLIGAVPFTASGAIPSYLDAVFETMSGFTTTGASILRAVEDLPKCLLFWRSFTHWIGGMGVLVFLLSLLPLTGGSHVNLMKAESPGPQVDKLVPKVQSTAKILYGIYFALTVLELVFLLVGRMPLFEAMLTAFGTAGTGGFGFRNDSFGSFSPYIQWVVTIFMILFGVNFNAYFLLLLRRFRRAASSEEVRAYFAIILAAVAVITVNIRSLYGTFGEALRPDYRVYMEHVVENCRTLGEGMTDGGLRLVSGGTDNHLCLVDLTASDITGKDAEKLLEGVGLTVNKNSIPNEPRSPFVTSGIRVGSAAATTRGFTADDFYEVGQLIAATVFNAESEAKLADVRAKVDALLAAHPLYPELDY